MKLKEPTPPHGPDLKPTGDSGGDSEKDSDGRISRLINSNRFFLDCVFVLCSEGKYRLVVLHEGRGVIDAPYSTLRGAKIAFKRFMGFRGMTEELVPQWTVCYHPQRRWLDEKLDMLKEESPIMPERFEVPERPMVFRD